MAQPGDFTSVQSPPPDQGPADGVGHLPWAPICTRPDCAMSKIASPTSRRSVSRVRVARQQRGPSPRRDRPVDPGPGASRTSRSRSHRTPAQARSRVPQKPGAPRQQGANTTHRTNRRLDPSTSGNAPAATPTPRIRAQMPTPAVSKSAARSAGCAPGPAAGPAVTPNPARSSCSKPGVNSPPDAASPP